MASVPDSRTMLPVTATSSPGGSGVKGVKAKGRGFMTGPG